MLLKKSLVGCALLFIVSIAGAQFSKGDRMVGSSIGAIFFNSAKTDYTYPAPTTGFTRSETGFGINLSPNYGWFVSGNTVVGATMILSFERNKYSDEDASNGNTFNEDETNQFSIGFGGFARNYFKSSGSTMPFAQVGFNFGMNSTKSEGFYFSSGNKSTYDGKSSGGFFANAGLTGGLTKMLNKNVGLDISLGYVFSYKKSEFKTTTLIDVGNNGSVDQTLVNQPTQKYTNHGVVFGVGLQVFLDKKK